MSEMTKKIKEVRMQMIKEAALDNEEEAALGEWDAHQDEKSDDPPPEAMIEEDIIMDIAP